MVGQVLLSNVMFALTTATINDWNAVSFGEATHPTTETASQTHQMRVVQLFIRTMHQPPPPLPKATRRVAQGVVSVQDDTVHTVIAAL